MKKRSVSIVLLLLAIPLVFAQGIAVGNDANRAVISPLGQASFDITVVNDGNGPDTLNLQLSDVAWSLSTKNTPDFTTGIDLERGASKVSTIYMKPSLGVEPGTYVVELRVTSLNTKHYVSHLFVVTVDPKTVDYSVTIPAEIIGSTSIDPAKSNSIKVRLTNPYPVFMEGLVVDASSKFLNKEAVVDLPPKSEKLVDFSLNIDASTPKQDDPLKITVKQKEKTIASIDTSLSIKEFKLPYKTNVKTIKRFLQTVQQITFTNTEGSTKTQDASIEKPSTYGMIYTSPVAETIVFDGKDYLTWSGVSLKADETYSVTVVQDYRTLAGVALLIVIVIAWYYQTRSPIIVKKKAYGVHKKDTGNNEIKVVLYLKNRTGKYLEKVRVLERLPFIHKIEPDFGPGTPEPKFRKSHEGIVLDWDIGLAPREERVFTYKMKSQLPIVGEYTLRPCVVQYGKSNKRVSSDSYRLFID